MLICIRNQTRNNIDVFDAGINSMSEKKNSKWRLRGIGEVMKTEGKLKLARKLMNYGRILELLEQLRGVRTKKGTMKERHIRNALDLYTKPFPKH